MCIRYNNPRISKYCCQNWHIVSQFGHIHHSVNSIHFHILYIFLQNQMLNIRYQLRFQYIVLFYLD